MFIGNDYLNLNVKENEIKEKYSHYIQNVLRLMTFERFWARLYLLDIKQINFYNSFALFDGSHF